MMQQAMGSKHNDVMKKKCLKKEKENRKWK
jgi:hypothetical protein